MTQTFTAKQIDEIKGSLEKILASDAFVRAPQLARFLQFAVLKTLEQKTEDLKEYRIGVEVYDRKPTYSPSQNSIVRTEAARLRSRLNQYYKTDGKDVPILINLQAGSYVPSFVFRQTQSPASSIEASPVAKRAGIVVAVLPFKDLSHSDYSANFSRGMSEELMHVMMRTDGFRVVSSSSIQPYLSEQDPVQAVAKKMDVQAVITGTVRHADNVVRVIAQVIDADGYQLDSQSFDVRVDSGNSMQIQEQIASALISRIGPQISRIRLMEETVSEADLKVYPAILSAYALLDRGTRVERRTALQKFQEISGKQPASVRALCGIAECFLDITFRGEMPPAEGVEGLRRVTDCAHKLDPDMVEVIANAAAVASLDWDFKKAVQIFEEALEIGPHAPTMLRFVTLLIGLKQFRKARHFLDIAARIDPFSNRLKIGFARYFYFSRQFEEGIAYASDSGLACGTCLEADLFAALSMVQTGAMDQALKLAERLQVDAAREAAIMAAVAEIFVACDKPTNAREVIDELDLLGSSCPVTDTQKATLTLALGDANAALKHLEAALIQRDPALFWLNVDARYDSLRDNDEFAKITKAVFELSA